MKKLSKKLPSRNGTYLIKIKGEYKIVVLLYLEQEKGWWIFDYPNKFVSYPYSKKEGILWGIKIE